MDQKIGVTLLIHIANSLKGNPIKLSFCSKAQQLNIVLQPLFCFGQCSSATYLGCTFIRLGLKSNGSLQPGGPDEFPEGLSTAPKPNGYKQNQKKKLNSAIIMITREISRSVVRSNWGNEKMGCGDMDSSFVVQRPGEVQLTRHHLHDLPTIGTYPVRKNHWLNSQGLGGELYS